MTVRDLLERLGDNMLCEIEVHWEYEVDPDGDKWMRADSRDAVIEMFGDWLLDKVDSIYFSHNDKDDDGLLQLYIKNPKTIEEDEDSDTKSEVEPNF